MDLSLTTPYELAVDMARERFNQLGMVSPVRNEERTDEAATEAPSEYVSVPYDYGYTAPAGATPTYISDGELMLWLQGKSEEMYGQVRALMDVSTERSKLIADLTHLKSMVDEDAPRDEIIGAMNSIQDAYAGTEFADEVEAVCGDQAQAELAAMAPVIRRLSDDEREGLATDIQGLTDELGREDQLTLVQIQSLMADIRETAQLTSNMIASGNQSADTIVGNIRG
jgi:hypothetical protein